MSCQYCIGLCVATTRVQFDTRFLCLLAPVYQAGPGNWQTLSISADSCYFLLVDTWKLTESYVHCALTSKVNPSGYRSCGFCWIQPYDLLLDSQARYRYVIRLYAFPVIHLHFCCSEELFTLAVICIRFYDVSHCRIHYFMYFIFQCIMYMNPALVADEFITEAKSS